ncbi:MULTISPECIES: hypothetical protein [unclassified Yoonia]|uniref:hypothetical protein n=1 Tax=unclassified Yoonia TaxID=2629118 RepID=UPI002B003E18|nr:MULTISPECIES: hypothetical protein [unclassified Yoonia]
MNIAPEFQILILNAVILGIAYLGIYPGLQEKTLQRMIAVDLVLTTLALTVAGALFWGSDVAFNMLFFNVNWAVFTILTLMLMEAPLFYVFARKHGISLTGR